MKIKLSEMAKALNVSNQQISKIKRELGYTKNQALYTEDIDKFRALKQYLCGKGGKSNPDFPKYYEKAMRLIEKSGFISYDELMKMFKVTHIEHVQAYFESRDNPIYDEDMYIDFKVNIYNKIGFTARKAKVYKLLNVVFDEWREENKIDCNQPSGMVRTGQSNIFRTAI